MCEACGGRVEWAKAGLKRRKKQSAMGYCAGKPMGKSRVF